MGLRCAARAAAKACGRRLAGHCGGRQANSSIHGDLVMADNIWVQIDPLEPMVTMVLIHCTGIISLVGLGAY